jgi:prepilin-type N-terminal cleavage/methylation domain-containing protein
MRQRPGFTLAELLVAVALFSVMAAGLSAIYGMVFRDQYRKVADMTAANGATTVRRAFAAAMAAATYLQDPASGAAADTLTVWANLDADGATALVDGLPVRFSQLCLDAAAQQVYLYEGAPPKPDFSCGDSPEGVTRTALAGGQGFESVSLAFYRPEPNLVQMTCAAVVADAGGARHPALVQTQAVANAHDQE